MTDSKGRYVVGIDLGTTNCALASARLATGGKPAVVESMVVQQLLDVEEVGDQPLLPSMAYLAGEHELPTVAKLPWPSDPRTLVGEAARRQGARIPGRLVASAKSWLCHAGVDRRAAILPWHAEEGARRISPVAASALFLSHLRSAWNHAHAEEPAARLEDQRVVLTVPASFDEAARELTLEAAKEAGLERVTLLEEPQAAFYDWMHAQGGPERARLEPGASCLVVDCGGGTTDFSLIAFEEKEGEARFVRLAVGDHLLLGGDNFDIALARHVEDRLVPGGRLDSTQWGSLVQSCRRAKEELLSTGEETARRTISVLGRGRKVVGGALSTEIDRATVRRIVLEGFFPRVGVGESPAKGSSAGLQEFGLPFVADPAITRHLAAFLRRHAASIRRASGGAVERPAAILFNGGVFNAADCRQAVLDALRSWYGTDHEPRVLSLPSLELAVARGAAAFGFAKETGRARIESSAARSYYIGVAAGERRALSAVCIVPHGLAEGAAVRIDAPALELHLGQPVRFPLFTSTVRSEDRAGDVLPASTEELERLPSLSTILRGGRRAAARTVRVVLESRLTEIGTLELHCAAKDGGGRWRLQFQIRAESEADASGQTAEDAATEPPPPDTWSEEELGPAMAAIEEAFAAPPGPPARDALGPLVRTLEGVLGLQRAKWPPSVLRSLADRLLANAGARTPSPDHEARWFNLVGFCLRPGWGDPVDPLRVERLWKLLHGGVRHATDRVFAEWWILWRRVAGGLDAARQKELAQRMLGYVRSGPGGKKPPRRAASAEISEIWRALASLERLEVGLKAELGDLLFRQLRKRPVPRHALWALTRLGNRRPIHAPANLALRADTATKWLDQLLAIPPADRQEEQELNFAVAQIARKTGDRVLDVDAETRSRVLAFLEEHRADASWIRLVREGAALERIDEDRILGDAAPPGLRLVED